MLARSRPSAMLAPFPPPVTAINPSAQLVPSLLHAMGEIWDCG